MKLKHILCATAVLTLSSLSIASTCKDLPNHDQFKAALIKARQANNGGFNFEMWGVFLIVSIATHLKKLSCLLKTIKTRGFSPACYYNFKRISSRN